MLAVYQYSRNTNGLMMLKMRHQSFRIAAGAGTENGDLDQNPLKLDATFQTQKTGADCIKIGCIFLINPHRAFF